jgi:hypothetical protein
MVGIKRKEAPKAVAAVRSGSEKKQKLASTGSSHKKAAPVKEPTPESDESSDEEEDELDDQDDAMSGVELEGENGESDEKKIRSTSISKSSQRHTTNTTCSRSIISRGTCCSACLSKRAQGRQTQRRHHRPQQEDLGETA